MKNTLLLSLFQACLALICGILMSKMSFVGRMGINLLHRDYLIFKTWWKTALLFWALQLCLIIVLALIRRTTSSRSSKISSLLFFLFGAIGLYITYIDFTTTSHQLMKMSFHSGGYLFWIGWLISCIFFFAGSKKKKIQLVNLQPTAEAKDL